MSRLGIIARCDVGGGLSVQTREIFRHLKPERTLLLTLGGAGRGDCNPSVYDLHQVSDQAVYPAVFDGAIGRLALDWLTAPGIDTLFSVETFYSDVEVLTRAHRNGIRTVLYANPELSPWSESVPAGQRPSVRPREILLPTGWRTDYFPGATVLEQPVARDRLPFRERTTSDHFLHVTGRAFEDRNGTAILLAALPHVTERCRLTIRTEKPLRLPSAPCVDVEVVSAMALEYWDAYPADADVLVMPRRYGGLCLPIQECASLGIPSVVLDSDPYARERFTTTIPALPPRYRPGGMKGAPTADPAAGAVPIFDADPRCLAAEIDRLVRAPEEVATMSRWANRWADAHAWEYPLGAEWRRHLRGEIVGP